MGVVFPDYLIHEEAPEKGEARKDFWIRILKGLKPGVTPVDFTTAIMNAVAPPQPA